ncbi:PQQ-dependent dehydrogenase, methanol/ethanol family [Methylococcus sp. EFPC2]|uniref:PQQ-dependent dehydrogenase, methanol/ethanol family n=1 Tax=Methylococcus sp. EFPC2 TaxID=2812648 RepID=UPI002739C690|nr:PQQ-dependent dehydrogenase, methanol/ethanol family [Methylococcus sp. EFPC2]
MKYTAYILGIAMLMPAANVYAFSGFYVNQADGKLYNQASQAIIARDGDSTVLTLSNDFQGEAKDFALVIPVPTVLRKDQVRVVDRALIEHLDAYSAPRLVEYPQPELSCSNEGEAKSPGAAGNGSSPPLGVRVEAAYTVGEYDFQMLSAEESGGLVVWLKQNGYRLPEGAEGVIGSYLKQDMRFLMAKVNLGAPARQGYGRLSPLQIRYQSRSFMLPIRLGTMNARGPQDLLIYTLTRKGRVESANYRTLPVPTDVDLPPAVKSDFGAVYRATFARQVERAGGKVVFTEYFGDLNGCDPCTAGPVTSAERSELGLSPAAGPVYLSRLHVRYDREHFPEDLVLTETGDTRSFQARYAIAWDAWGQYAAPEGPLRPYYDNLAELTGWSADKIAALADGHPEAGRGIQGASAKPRYSDPPVAVETLSREQRQWTTWGGDLAGTSYSPLNQINRSNAWNLQPLWQFSTGALGGHEGGPLVVDDVIYIHTGYPHKVYALSQISRSVLWGYYGDSIVPSHLDPVRVREKMCCAVNRGLAYGDGKIFLAQGDASLVALDAKTGKIVWKVVTGDPRKGETSTNAPLVVKDKVITGVSGGEFGVRGYLAAYRIEDGSLAWKAYSTGPDADMKVDAEKTLTWRDGRMQAVGPNSSLESWQGDQWKIGGGTTWGWYSYDPASNLVYYGTGNPGTWNPVRRPGDNRWSNALWARDAGTGVARWVYQTTPHDQWAYDGTSESMLIERPVKDRAGKIHDKLLVHMDRNGYGYTLDRITGELLVTGKFDEAVNWARQIDPLSGRPEVDPRYSPETGGEDHVQKGICPSNLGAKSQGPAAYSPRTGLAYVPGRHECMDYDPFKVEYHEGSPYTGAATVRYPASQSVKNGEDESRHHAGSFTAWDPGSGKVAWQVDEPVVLQGGMTATAGDVVIHGTPQGEFKVRDALNGEELYRFKTPSGIIGNVSTWEHRGKHTSV